MPFAADLRDRGDFAPRVRSPKNDSDLSAGKESPALKP